MVRPEFVKVGMSFVFREGNTKGIGQIVQCIDEEFGVGASSAPVVVSSGPSIQVAVS